jgi:hypothetical protein
VLINIRYGQFQSYGPLGHPSSRDRLIVIGPEEGLRVAVARR